MDSDAVYSMRLKKTALFGCAILKVPTKTASKNMMMTMTTFRAQVFASLSVLIGGLMLAFSASAAEMFTDIAPDQVLGSGSYSLRVKILDPVTQLAWANKPYRMNVYEALGKASAVILGNTDSQGYTATLKTAKPATDFVARPRLQAATFPFITQLKITQSFDGKGIAHAQYIHFFGDGGVYTGISDERGDTAEIGSTVALTVKTQIGRYDTFKEICDWQATASLLNQTVASKPAQKIALIKQVLNQPDRKKTGKDDCFSLNQQYGDYLVSQLLHAALAGGADLLNASASLIVDKKTERLIAADLADKAAANNTPQTPAQLRVKAILDLVDEASALEAVSPDFLKKWVDEAMLGFNGLGKTSTFEDEGKMLKLADKFVWRKEVGLAEKLIKASNSTSNQSYNETDLALQLAVEAMIAKSKGDSAGAQTLFEDANNWLAGSAEKDVLSAYRAEFKNVPFGQMRISAAMLLDAQQWCPQISESREGVVEMFSFEERNTRSMSRVLTLDALLTYGTAKAGKVMLAQSCKTPAATFELSQQDIEQIRAAISVGGLLVLRDKNSEHYHVARLQLALLAWLQSVKLTAGVYQPNKITEKLNFGF